ncbi:MAG: YbhB/YbcL family Raf kinase inhibitor-like protein [Candidatus Hydrogenedentes bacterium]|nr:YbhB/YbcL family Raf kinase inhibitor-like protein [Candidatus Hydrogenedentota bacterium]
MGATQDSKSDGAAAGNKEAAKPGGLELSSSAFKQAEYIPLKYTGDGADVSPPLKWSGAPDSAKSLALICDDPDAPMGTWVHWVLYAIPPATHELPEAVPKTERVPGGMKQGVNSFGKVGYGGPAPPKRSDHRYCFKLYALDTELPLDTRASKSDLEKAMKGHIIADTQLMGRYKR